MNPHLLSLSYWTVLPFWTASFSAVEQRANALPNPRREKGLNSQRGLCQVEEIEKKAARKLRRDTDVPCFPPKSRMISLQNLNILLGKKQTYVGKGKMCTSSVLYFTPEQAKIGASPLPQLQWEPYQQPRPAPLKSEERLQEELKGTSSCPALFNVFLSPVLCKHRGHPSPSESGDIAFGLVVEKTGTGAAVF